MSYLTSSTCRKYFKASNLKYFPYQNYYNTFVIINPMLIFTKIINIKINNKIFINFSFKMFEKSINTMIIL